MQTQPGSRWYRIVLLLVLVLVLGIGLTAVWESEFAGRRGLDALFDVIISISLPAIWIYLLWRNRHTRQWWRKALLVFLVVTTTYLSVHEIVDAWSRLP